MGLVPLPPLGPLLLKSTLGAPPVSTMGPTSPRRDTQCWPAETGIAGRTQRSNERVVWLNRLGLMIQLNC